MKYVRTKENKILRVFCENVSFWDKDDSITYYGKTTKENDFLSSCLLSKNEIVKSADTIEELCDFFVVVKEKVKPYIIEEALDMSDIWYEAADRTQKVYGAILTKNGITFVTKPLDCEEGELKLL